MFHNYLRIAIRNIKRNSVHAILNISGLAIALAACILIFLVLQHEFSYDTYHKNAANVYQVVKKIKHADGEGFDRGIPFPAMQAFKIDFPEAAFTEIFTAYGSQVTVMTDAATISNKKFIEERGIIYCEPEMFSMLDVELLSGSFNSLNEPGKALIDRTMAVKYFGDWQQATGKYLKIDNNILIQVAGVIKDVPANTDFPFRIIPSYKTFLSNKQFYGYTSSIDNWGGSTSNHQVYLQLPASVQVAEIEKRMAGFISKHHPDRSGMKTTVFLQPLTNIHFDNRFGNNGDHVSSKTSLYTLALIGLLVILMACINFINLSTALAVKRSKEVGIRKVMGSNKLQLRLQVYAETGLIVLLAAAIGVILASLSLPYLKHIADIQEKLHLVNPGSVLFILAAVLITTLLSGLYPSVVMSRFKPVEAIKNKISSTQVGGISLRRILVVMQFAFSQLLIISTIIAVSQMNFIRTADLGLKKEAVLLLAGNGDSTALARHTGFRSELQQLPEVKMVSFSYDAPSSDNNWTTNFSFNNVDKDLDFNTHMKFADENYQKVFGLELSAGEFYRDNDSVPKVVVNETLIHKVGLKDPQEAIGKTIRLGRDKWLPIVGVVKDFKNNSLREAVQPTVIMKEPQFMGLTAVKLQSPNLATAKDKVQRIWDKFYPEYAYNSIFYDEAINNFYRQEERLSRLYKVYAGLAILISCLGLYGLVSFMAVQKTKEVGIRKVLGASIGNIVFLFSREFTFLILIAFLIAAPLGWFLMSSWLQNFVFRINIGIGVFALAIFTSIVIAWITVGYKALKAALANPVKSLRTE